MSSHYERAKGFLCLRSFFIATLVGVSFVFVPFRSQCATGWTRSQLRPDDFIFLRIKTGMQQHDCEGSLRTDILKTGGRKCSSMWSA